MAKMTIDYFTDVMNDFIEKNHVQLLIDMPEGTQEPKLIDNVHLGSVVQFYILLAAIPAAFRALNETLNGEADERVIDTMLDLAKKDMMAVIKEGKKNL